MRTWLSRLTEDDAKPRRQAVPKKIILTKRRRFLLVALILTLGLFGMQQLPVESRIVAFGLYGFLSYVLCAWSLFKDLRGVAWVTNLIMPSLFPVAVGLFYFLLPQHEVTRLIVGGLFFLSMYALLLTTNIFAVASIRTIQLLRAARAVGFLLTVLTAAFLFHFIFSLRVGVPIVAMMTAVVSWPIFIFGTWSYVLGERLGAKELAYSLIGTLITVEMAVAISFWLVDVSLISIFLAMIVYVSLGIFQHDLEDRLFVRTIQEYLGFGALVWLIVVAVVLTRWLR